jgi:hypothetical protein
MPIIERVVWLCAHGWHRSGERDDAFQLDRQRRFVELVP